MHISLARELEHEVSTNQPALEGAEGALVERLLARIARRPGLWRRRMRTRHRRAEERLSPLPHTA
jgi:hypothetical protein